MDSVKEKATVKKMQKQCLFLKNYLASLRLQSILYDCEENALRVEDERAMYVSNTHDQTNKRDNSTYNAQIMIEHMKKQPSDQHAIQASILLKAIRQLPQPHQQLLIDIYVLQLDKSQVLVHCGNIVDSTFHRRLKKALISLANVLSSAYL